MEGEGPGLRFTLTRVMRLFAPPLFDLLNALGQQNTANAGMAQLQRFVFFQKLCIMAVVVAVVFRGVQFDGAIFDFLDKACFGFCPY